MASVKIIELTETNTCKICDNALAKYSCPRCNLLYCSINCYQANCHLQCSENFYKENVLQELSLDKDSNSKTRMLEILQKTHESNRISYGADGNVEKNLDDLEFVDIENLESDEDDSEVEKNLRDLDFVDIENLDSDDDDDFDDIANRLAGVDLDDAEQVWDKLTEDEKQEFVAFLKSEDVTKLIPSWEPWWLYYNENKVEDVSETENFKNGCPKIAAVKDFSEISSKPPAECVKYNLVNVLTAYVFTTRYFNGEHFDFAKEAVSCIASLSRNLKDALNFEDFETAIKHVEQECSNCEWILTDIENIQTMRNDLIRVLRGPSGSEKKFYIMCALSDLHHLLEESLKSQESGASSFEKKFPSTHFPTVNAETPEKIKMYIKKIEYCLSYTKDCYVPFDMSV